MGKIRLDGISQVHFLIDLTTFGESSTKDSESSVWSIWFYESTSSLEAASIIAI